MVELLQNDLRNWWNLRAEIKVEIPRYARNDKGAVELIQFAAFVEKYNFIGDKIFALKYAVWKRTSVFAFSNLKIINDIEIASSSIRNDFFELRFPAKFL